MKFEGAHYFGCCCAGTVTVTNLGPIFDRKNDMKCSRMDCRTPLVHPADYEDFRQALVQSAPANQTPTTEVDRNAHTMGIMKTYGKHAVGSRNLVLQPGESNPNVGVPNAAKANRLAVVKKIITLHLAGLDKEESELMELGRYLETRAEDPPFPTSADLKWVQGPRKTAGRAFEKTSLDYALDIGQNKDWVRGTLVAASQLDLRVAVGKIYYIAKARFGLEVTKDQEVIPSKANLGYSGWNFNVASLNGRYKGEIQANTYAVMYGKETKEDFKKKVNFGEGDYAVLAARIGIRGGMGHALYEIYRDSESTIAVKKEAAETSEAYYGICRQYETKSLHEKWVLNERLANFGKNLARDPSQKKFRNIWQHAGGPR